jgi:4-amino-4-deoxy-L-arabinose transferase-like glycosyltransferase
MKSDEEQPRPRPPQRLGGADALVATGLGGGYVAWLAGTVKDLGYARDEGFYFQASSAYGRWFEQLLATPRAALDRRAVDAAWSANHEHPALVKSLFALSNLVLQKKHHLFVMEGTSYRFPAMVLAGIVVALVYLWGTQARGRVAGVAAAVALAAMPRFFFHAHLACFDVPIVTMWTLTAYLYWRSLRDGGVILPLLTGVAFGLTLDTKHNSWFLPFACVAHLVALEAWGALSRARPFAWLAKPPAPGVVRRRGLAALGAMAVVGPPVFVALWPWIWHDTAHRLRDYALFHLNHEYYNMEFLGENYWTPPMPRGYAWLMTLATVPTVTIALFAVGLGTRALAWTKRPTSTRAPVVDAMGTDLLWLIGVVVNYAAWLRASTPIFGGTKHWMTAYPFLALFAGAGFSAVVRAARRELARQRRRGVAVRRLAASPWAAAAAIGAATGAAPLTETIRSHPWGLSAYTPLVGGAAGAASLGLNRTFWGYATGAVAGFLNREAPRGATVYVHDTASPSWDMLLTDGRIRRDIRGVGSIAGASFGLYHHEKHMLGQEYQNWIAFGTARPAYIGGLDGVPVILVYEQPSIMKGARPAYPQ